MSSRHVRARRAPHHVPVDGEDLSSAKGRSDRALGVRLLAGAVAVVVVTVPLTVLTALVLSKNSALRDWDSSVVDAVHGQVAIRPTLARVLGWISTLTHPNSVRLVTGVLVVVLWLRGRRRAAAWLAVTVAVGGALDPVLKNAVARARPAFDHPVALAPGYSFPSGHALNSMLLAACLVILVQGPTRGRPGLRATARAAAVALVLVTGADRVGLGVHYVTDVVAGWLVALTTVAVTTTAFESWRRDVGLPPSSPETGLDPGPTDPPGTPAPHPDRSLR